MEGINQISRAATLRNKIGLKTPGFDVLFRAKSRGRNEKHGEGVRVSIFAQNPDVELRAKSFQYPRLGFRIRV